MCYYYQEKRSQEKERGALTTAYRPYHILSIGFQQKWGTSEKENIRLPLYEFDAAREQHHHFPLHTVQFATLSLTEYLIV